MIMPASHTAYAADSANLIPHGGWAYPRQLTPASAWGAPPAPAVPSPPAYLATPALQPHAETPAPTDPYAPRRDAPIFRLQETPSVEAPTTTAQTQDAPRAPSANGSRYYSVHRQAGRQPDSPRLPEPVYLDALPVELTNPVSSDDLAAPAAAPQMIRDANGRLRAVADLEDPL